MKLFPISILLLVSVSFIDQAEAQTTWSGNASDNQFETAGNWSAGVPTATLGAVVTGSSTITINETSDQSAATLTIGSTGTVNLNVSGGNTLTVVGEVPTTSAQDILIDGGGTLNFSGGNLKLTDGILVLGDTNGSGAFNLTGGTLNYDNQLNADATQVNIANGGTGTFTQTGTSTVVTGNILFIGTNGGTGNYNLSGNATLTTGTMLQTGNYFVAIGANNAPGITGTTGTLAISGSGTLNLLTASQLQLGAVAAALGSGSVQAGTRGGTGVIVQNGAGSTVNLEAGSTAFIGAANGGVGIYDLMSGTLNVDNLVTSLGQVNGANGTLAQSGGVLTEGGATEIDIGTGGQGTYTLSAGRADMAGTFIVGSLSGSVGLWAQSNGAFVGEVGSTVTVGGAGSGTYDLSGGTADFKSGLAVGASGKVNQTGGTLTIESGSTLNLNTPGSAYNLNGGVLLVSDSGGNNGIYGSTNGGSLNFGGGILRSLSGGLTDGVNGTLTGNSEIDTTNGQITLSGNLGGAGGLTLAGGGIVTLMATDTYTGPTSINAGTNLTLIVPDSIDRFGSGVAGAGLFDIDFNAGGNLVEMAGTSAFTGTTVIGANGNQGTLRVFNGSFGNIGDGGTMSALDIGGDSAIAVGGAVLLTGTNTFTGTTSVSSGFSLYANNLAGDLSNSGTVGVYPNGIYQTGTFAIVGNLTSPGNLLVRTNGTTTDLYTATGTADLTNGTVTISGFGTIRVPVPIVTAGSLVAPLNALTLDIAGAHVLFTGTLSEVGNSLELTTTQFATAAFAQTGNERAVSGAIDPVLLRPDLFFVTPPTNFVNLAVAMNGLNAAQIPVALDQLSPESLQYARNISIENSSFLAQSVNGVLANVRSGYAGLDTSGLSMAMPGMDSGLGRSLQSMLAYNSPAYFDNAAPRSGPGSRAESMSDSENEPMKPASFGDRLSNSRISEFIRGDVILADLNRDQSVSNAAPTKASYTAGDVSAGVSYRMTSNLAAGVLFDYNHTDAKTDSSGSKTKVDTFSPGLYATYFKDGFYVNGLASYGYDGYTNTRDISFAGLTAKSSPSGSQYVGNLDTGYDFQPEKHWILGPTLGLTYTHLDIGSFAETGAGLADLTVNSQSVDSLRSRLGGHVIYQTRVDHVLLQPSVTMMWQHEYLDDSDGITSQLNIPGTTAFSIQTAAPTRDSALLGCGLTASLDSDMAVYLSYLADVGSNAYLAQSVEGGFKAKF